MELAQVVWVGFILYLAIKSNDTFLLLVSTPLAGAFGFLWYDTYGDGTAMVIALVTASLGFYCLWKAIMNMVGK